MGSCQPLPQHRTHQHEDAARHLGAPSWSKPSKIRYHHPDVTPRRTTCNAHFAWEPFYVDRNLWDHVRSRLHTCTCKIRKSFETTDAYSLRNHSPKEVHTPILHATHNHTDLWSIYGAPQQTVRFVVSNNYVLIALSIELTLQCNPSLVIFVYIPCLRPAMNVQTGEIPALCLGRDVSRCKARVLLDSGIWILSLYACEKQALVTYYAQRHMKGKAMMDANIDVDFVLISVSISVGHYQHGSIGSCFRCI